MRGEFAVPEEPVKQKKQMRSAKSSEDCSFNFPNFVLNSMTVKTFNTLYYGKARMSEGVHY